MKFGYVHVAGRSLANLNLNVPPKLREPKLWPVKHDGKRPFNSSHNYRKMPFFNTLTFIIQQLLPKSFEMMKPCSASEAAFLVGFQQIYLKVSRLIVFMVF